LASGVVAERLLPHLKREPAVYYIELVPRPLI